MSHYPFSVTDLESVDPEEHRGASGTSFWKTLQLPGLRIRQVEYTAGYLADHWCTKGHIVYCLQGSFETTLQTGEKFELQPGMCYVVSDDLSSHQSYSASGVKLLIIDGDFLQLSNENL